MKNWLSVGRDMAIYKLLTRRPCWPCVGVELEGGLAEKPEEGNGLGPPVQSGVTMLRELNGLHQDVFVITSRNLEEVADWLVRHDLNELVVCVTASRLPALVYVEAPGEPA